jgi:hypothetical protein
MEIRMFILQDNATYLFYFILFILFSFPGFGFGLPFTFERCLSVAQHKSNFNEIWRSATISVGNLKVRFNRWQASPIGAKALQKNNIP